MVSLAHESQSPFSDCQGPLREKLLPLKEIAGQLPGNSGKSLAYNTIHKWSRRGCKGVRLEVHRLGGKVVSSFAAVERFMVALDARERQLDVPVPSAMTEADKRRSERYGLA